MLYRPGLLGRMPCPMDWYWGSGPPTVDEAFTGAALPAGWTFTRTSANATNCLCTDGVSTLPFTTYAANTPRFLDFGLLMEPARTNLYLNSETPVANQTITVALGPYTMWGIGAAGTGAYISGGTATFTGFNSFAVGTPAVFTVTTAGTVIITTVGGTPTRIQVEAGASATSYIVSGATAQTRTEDRLNKFIALNRLEGTYWVEFIANGVQAVSTSLMCAGGGSYSSSANADQITLNNTTPTPTANAVVLFASGVSGQLTLPAGNAVRAVSRVAMSVSLNRMNAAIDYTLSAGAVDPNYRQPSLIAITLGGGGSGNFFNGFIRGFKYWPVAMPDAELKECTGTEYYPPGPTFSYDFTTGVFPRRIVFTRASIGTYFDVAGTLQTATANTPRFDYDPVTHAARGLLIEESRTNQVLNSAAPPWTLVSSTQTFASGVAPDGTNTMYLLAEVAASATHYKYGQYVTTASTPYVFTVFAKAAQNQFVQISLDDGSTNGAYVNFDLSAGTISRAITQLGTGGTPGTATIQAVGNGVYRLSVSNTITTTSTRATIVLINSGTTTFAPVYLGNAANGLLLWGHQLEAAAFPTSYIPTTAAAVTRSLEVCQMPTASFSFVTTYSMMMAFDSVVASTRGGISDNVFANAAYFSLNNFTRVGGVAGNTLTYPGPNKQCGTVGPVNVRVCNNGLTVALLANNPAPQTTATRVTFGNDPWSLTSAINGHIRLAAYWTRELSDSEMKQVTT